MSLDAISSSMINLSGSSDFSQFQFVLIGISKGGEPTNFTWRRDGVDLASNAPYTIVHPELINDVYICSERIYRSRLSVTGRLPGVFTYTVNNADTVNDIMGMFTVEGML